jgi:hypothetical protein
MGSQAAQVRGVAYKSRYPGGVLLLALSAMGAQAQECATVQDVLRVCELDEAAALPRHMNDCAAVTSVVDPKAGEWGFVALADGVITGTGNVFEERNNNLEPDCATRTRDPCEQIEWAMCIDEADALSACRNNVICHVMPPSPPLPPPPCPGVCKRADTWDDWGCEDRENSDEGFGCSSFHGTARDCHWECDVVVDDGGVAAAGNQTLDWGVDAAYVGSIVGGVIGGLLYLCAIVWAVQQMQGNEAHPFTYIVILPFLIVAGVGVGLVMLCKRAQKMAEERARAEAQARAAVERLERQQKEAAERAAAMAAMKARVDAAIEAGAVFVPCVKPVLQQMDLNATPDDTSDDVELLVVYAGYARAPCCPGRLSAHLPREPDALPRGPAQVHLHAWRAHGQRLLPDGAAHQV